MLNLDHFEEFCSKLQIKHRDTGMLVPFVFNPSQRRIMERLRVHQAKGYHLWIIYLKARRLGISRLMLALGIAHMLQKAHANGKIVAQLTETAKELFTQSREFADQLPCRLPSHTQRELYFPHSGGISVLSRATAKTVIGGRGLTHSFLHLTEAAFYPGEDSFVALLNTVSGADPDNIVGIETTANGIEGPGEAYFNYWKAAEAEQNEFLAIFLPWWEDPATRMPNKYAPDAPADDYEKWLMKEFHCTKGQIAWFRSTLETKCGGSIYKWKQEYPATPDEAFISSGDPIFDFEELEYMRKSCCDPIARGDVLGQPSDLYFDEAQRDKDAPLQIWEQPVPGAHYFIGVDAAKGVEEGDFAASIGWNAETGAQAFTYAAKVGPERLADVVNWLGLRYNRGMLNVELTGGWGYQVMKDLRDKYHYPNQYLWRSRDDKPDTKPRQAFGWETTDRSRQMLFTVFRKAVRASLPRDYGDGPTVSSPEVVVRDIRLYSQASRAQSDIGFRWKVVKGHDDILVAGWLGYIALSHYHLPHPYFRTSNLTKSEEGRLPLHIDDSPESTADGVIGMYSSSHLKRVLNYERNRRLNSDRLLEGI